MAASPNAFGPYTLSARLGSGATSTVFLASHPDIPHPIALKLLSSKVTSDADWLARFQREALVMQRLQHRNIVAYHEFGQIDGR